MIPSIGTVGKRGSGGTGSYVREGETLEMITGWAHGKYYEASSTKLLYTATSTTGRAPGTALSTAPPILLYNPVGSGRRFSLLKVGVSNAPTGTLGSGAIYHCAFTLYGPVASQIGVIPVVGSGAALTPLNLNIGSQSMSVATVFSLGTLAVAPTALYPAFQVGESVGGTTTNDIQSVLEDVDGMITIEPGCGWCLYGVTAAGSTPLVLCGITWEEISVP